MKIHKINWRTIPFQAAVVWLAGIDPQMVNGFIRNPQAAQFVRFVLVCCGVAVSTFHWHRPGEGDGGAG